MSRSNKGEQTRQRILDVAQGLVLRKGFGGTSIDEIVADSDITKGGFFYHFRGKSDLARELLVRYVEEDHRFLDGLSSQARDLVEDPLQRALLFLKLLANALHSLPGVHPGCLVATYTYESQIFDPEVRRLAAEGLLGWQRVATELFEPVLATRTPHEPVTAERLAEQLMVVMEGAILISRTLDDATVLSQQILQFRQHVRLLFE